METFDAAQTAQAPPAPPNQWQAPAPAPAVAPVATPQQVLRQLQSLAEQGNAIAHEIDRLNWPILIV